ncbi:Olfactory receptor 7G1 [Sciurus carolinensis]|uniref:Olfactory receptor 7G1 n=1 Tax=Sciurus carolinensis TaxID=30640 RepID=A0AA41N1J1_SCICA|nr:Olfactory receptor 7G1 [Sciurus carolinensis]
MEPTNQTAVSEFLLLGLTDDPTLQSIIFSLFLSMYLVTILGNLLIILAVSSDSSVDALLHTLMLLRLSFCAELEIPHSFCELVQVIKLAFSDTSVDNVLIYIATYMFGGIPLSGIIFSYVHIVCSVLRMPSSRGKHKAFSTCGSHLSVVSLFYGAAFVVYISSAVTDSPRKTAVASVMYSVVPQMLNPFIYSMRNRNLKEALRNLIGKTTSLL